METIDEYQTEEQTEGEFQLTAEVITDVATFSEITPEAAPEVAEVSIEEQPVELDLFEFAPAEILPEELGIPPSSELTPLEQQTIDAMLTGDFDPFSDYYRMEDGHINMEVWWGASTLYNNLVYNGIAPENFEAVATEWFSV